MAGLTAAWHAARRGLSTALMEGELLFGGQIANVEAIEGYPAAGETSGITLAMGLVESLQDLDVPIIPEQAEALTGEAGRWQVASASQNHRAQNVIVATGARLRVLGVPGEEEMRGRGVSQCATCDGPLFRGEDVVVVGGGDAALQEALVLAGLCQSVTIVSRGALRAKRACVDRITACDNVSFVWDATVEAVLGEGTVTGVRLKNTKDGTVSDHACNGVFPFIGGEPNADFLPDAVARNAGGHVLTDATFRTALDGVYAVGAVRAGYSGELVSATGEAAAAIAAIAAVG